MFNTKIVRKALIPINEDTIIPVCKNSEKFNNIFLPRFQDLEIALDKKGLLNFCLKLGIPAPQTFFPHDPRDLKKLAKKLKKVAYVFAINY